MVLNFLNFSTLSQFFMVKLFNKSLLLRSFFSIFHYSAVKRVIKQGDFHTTTRAMASIESKDNECYDWLND